MSRPTKGDLVEYLVDGDPFTPKGQLGVVLASAWHTGPRAFRVHVEWFDDTRSFAQPHEVRVVVKAHGKPKPDQIPSARIVPYEIHADTKQIIGVLK